MLTPASRRGSWLVGLLQATGLIVLLLWGTAAAWARPTTPDEAKSVVEGWLSLGAAPLSASLGQQVKEVKSYSSKEGFDLYFIVYLNPAGFVVVPADDLVEPIIAFLPEGTYDPAPINPLGALVSQDVTERVLAARLLESQSFAAEAAPQELQAVETNQNKWNRLKTPRDLLTAATFDLTSISDVRVSPLIQSKWSQSIAGGSACYNYYTPPYGAGNSANYVCGCVATAMAQLMRFWEHPANGVGTSAFTIYVEGVARTDYLQGGDGAGGAYHWSSMALIPANGATEAQRQAIGALTHDAGVSVNMKYTSGESGAQNVGATSLRTTFGYSNAKLGVDSYNIPTTARNNMVNPNLDAGYPVLFGILGSAGGHAIVCDGYGYNLSTAYHHLNMGWAGYDDAWYNLPNIDTTNYEFTKIGQIAYNVYVTGSGEIISGRVLDTSGNPVAGALVTAVKSGGGGTYTATSNSRGIYALAKVPSGSSYTISAAKSGYTFDSHTVATLTSTDNGTNCGNLWAVDLTGSTAPTPEVSLNTALDNGVLTFATGGNVVWAGKSSTYYYGGSAAQSGAIGHSQSSLLQTTLAGPGTISFYWKVSSEATYDFLEVYLDDGVQDRISGTQDWQLKTVTIPAGNHTIKWNYRKDSNVSYGSDCGWVDKVVYTPTVVNIPLKDALDAPNLTFTTGGDANWGGESSVSHFGGSAAASGSISHSESTWFQTTVSGQGTLSFYWKVSSENNYDYLRVYLDGNQLYQISGDINWQLKTLAIPSGSHLVKWVYSKDISVEVGSDCAWVDQLVFTPTPTGRGALPGVLQLLLNQ